MLSSRKLKTSIQTAALLCAASLVIACSMVPTNKASNDNEKNRSVLWIMNFPKKLDNKLLQKAYPEELNGFTLNEVYSLKYPDQARAVSYYYFGEKYSISFAIYIFKSDLGAQEIMQQAKADRFESMPFLNEAGSRKSSSVVNGVVSNELMDGFRYTETRDKPVREVYTTTTLRSQGNGQYVIMTSTAPWRYAKDVNSKSTELLDAFSLYSRTQNIEHE